MTPAEEHEYLTLRDALRDLWNGTADEDCLELVCVACGVDVDDALADKSGEK